MARLSGYMTTCFHVPFHNREARSPFAMTLVVALTSVAACRSMVAGSDCVAPQSFMKFWPIFLTKTRRSAAKSATVQALSG